MKKIQGFIEEKVAPPLIRFSRLKYIVIMQKTFMAFMSLLIVGSLFLLLTVLPVADLSEKAMTIYNIGTNFTAIFVAIAAAYFTVEWYNEKRNENNDYLTAVIIAVASYLVMIPVRTLYGEGSEELSGVSTGFLGTQGIFCSMLVAIISVELYRFLLQKNVVIKMPKGVPPMVAQAFASLIPSAVILGIWWILRVLLGINLPALVMDVFKPLVQVSDTPGAVYMTALLNGALWSVGIHGGNVIGAVATPFWTQMTMENLAALEAGLALPYKYTLLFYENYLQIGLVPISLLMCASKSKRLKTLGWLSLLPSLFNIAEPILFGIPVCMNPIMIIPFILFYIIVSVAAVALTSMGVLATPAIIVPWVTPSPIKTYLATQGNLTAVLFVLGAWVLMAVLFYPFLKIIERQDTKAETAAD